MNIIVAISIASIIVIDFLKLDKNNKRVIYLYIAILSLTILVIILNKYEFFKMSPLEILIDKMQPLTNWIKI